MSNAEKRWLTREEAVALLITWRKLNVPQYNLDFSYSMICGRITSGLENIYINGLVDELIERIRNSALDPITVVANYYYEMDKQLVESSDESFRLHFFASYMENKAHDILWYLRSAEKEIINYERKHMV